MADDSEAFKTNLSQSDTESAPPNTNHAVTPDGRGILKAEPVAPVATVPQPPPNGGLRAWIQVLGAHFLFFNSW